MVLTQLQALSAHTDGAQCELIKVDPRINLDSLAIQLRHGTSMSHKEVGGSNSELPEESFHMIFRCTGISSIYLPCSATHSLGDSFELAHLQGLFDFKTVKITQNIFSRGWLKSNMHCYTCS